MSFFTIDDQTLHYDLIPGNGPCMVLSHGYGMSGEAWRDFAAAISAAGYAVLTYDHRCCGRSSMDFTDVTVATQGADLAALCEHLELDRVVLNGWSLGGAIVVDAASRLGDRLAGLVLTGGATPRYTQAEGFPHGGAAEDVEATVAAIRQDRGAFLKTLYFDGVFVAPVDEAVKENCVRIALQAGETSDDSLGDLAYLDQRDMLSAIECPALVIHGLQDGVVPVDIGRFATSQLSNATLIEMDNCGHAPFLEYPEDYHAALIRFIGEVA